GPPATTAARTNCNGFGTERDRNVGVRRSALDVGLIAKMSINRACNLKNASIPLKLTTRTVANDDHLGIELEPAMRITAWLCTGFFFVQRLLEGASQFEFEALDLRGGTGAQVDSHAGGFRNGIH